VPHRVERTHPYAGGRIPYRKFRNDSAYLISIAWPAIAFQAKLAGIQPATVITQ
jgi:hypothetical protein